MRKISFKTGERVAVIESNQVKNGVIIRIIPDIDPPVFVVKFEDDSIAKVRIENVAKISEDLIQEEPVENREVTITAEDFFNVGTRAIAETVEGIGPSAGFVALTLSMFLAKLQDLLFIGAEND